MDASETMRRLRYALEIDDAEAQRLIHAGGGQASTDEVASWRTRPDQPDHAQCPSAVIYQMMDGLIADRRGPPEDGVRRQSRSASPTVDNNQLLKSLRIALSLQADELRNVFLRGGASVSQNEVAALLRKPGTRNFRRCGDQLLRQFFNGLATGRSRESGSSGDKHDASNGQIPPRG